MNKCLKSRRANKTRNNMPNSPEPTATEPIYTRWEDLLGRGKKDLLLSQRLINDDPDDAAYKAQQALEKHIKALMLRFGVVTNPKKLGHFPMYGIMKTIKDIMKNMPIPKHLKDAGFPNPEDVINGCLKELKSIERNPTIMIAWWRHSLGIPLNNEEKKICNSPAWAFPQQIQNIEAVTRTQLQQSKNNQDTYTRLKKPSKNSIENDALRTETVLTEQEQYNKTNDAVVDISNRDFTANENHIDGSVIPKLGSGHHDIDSELLSFALGNIVVGTTRQNQKFPMDLKGLLVCIICAGFVDKIIDVLPHEVIGRYPAVIDGEKTSVLYNRHRDGLSQLIKGIADSCQTIEKRIIELEKLLGIAGTSK